MKKTFSVSQITLHWLVFIGVVVAYTAIELKGFWPKGSVTREMLAQVHYTAGISVLLLMIIRIFLKIRHRDPLIVPAPPRWQTILAKSAHGILYLMFLALPVLGILIVYFGQKHGSFFGITLPVAAVANKVIQRDIKEIHELIANVGYFVIGLHAAAALFHHYIVRDNTLQRMLPIAGAGFQSKSRSGR